MKRILISLAILMMTMSLFADIRLATYNALNFGNDSADRISYFETIFNQIDADVYIFQEIEDGFGAELMLEAANDGSNEFSSALFLDGPDTNNLLIYRNSNVIFASQDTIGTALRNISEFELLIDGNLIRFYSCHLKASTGYENERLEEVTKLRNHLNQLDQDSEFIIVGDMNFYTSSEPGYQKFIADENNNIGRAEDLSDQVGDWHNNINFAEVHTQSTRSTQFGGGASGGLDDRFDFIFSSYQLNNGVGLEYVANSITSFGNDGDHFNLSINDGTNSVVPPDVAEALYLASDHLPVFADFATVASSQPIIVVTIPNIQEEWQQGTEHLIKWVSSNFDNNVQIELQSENTDERQVLVNSTENDGEWLWEIPEDQIIGAYKIIVSDEDDGDPTDESNNPFYIIEPTSEYTIYDIQYSVNGPSPLEGVEVITNGIVTGAAENNYFLQDGEGAWNGIFVYDYAHSASVGDEINITAEVAEYFDKTELTDIVDYSILSSGNTIPQAVLLETNDVNQEDYEGVLVKVENAECTSYDQQYGEWLVDDGSGEVMVNDMMYEFVPVIGEVYDITGNVDYAYGSFRIEPRNTNDVVLASSVNEDLVSAEVNLSNFPNPFNPTTTISFNLLFQEAEITIYNLKGQKIRVFHFDSENIEETVNNRYSIVWDGKDFNNNQVSSGIYYYKIKMGDLDQVKKMLLLK